MVISQKNIELENLRDVDALRRFDVCKAMARGLADSWSDERRLILARSFCAATIEAYWDVKVGEHNIRWEIKKVPYVISSFGPDETHLSTRLGQVLAQFPAKDAGFFVGTIYTLMLPDGYRSKIGAYYTPPALVERLLDLAEQAGFNFRTGSAIDPACGGGAFLSPVALRMLEHMPHASPEWTFKHLVSRLKGIEIDPFAAWMSEVLLEVALMPLCVQANKRLPKMVHVANALTTDKEMGNFDLVIGNPPYGRAKIGLDLRKKYERSLYGHANLYGMFLDLAIRLAKPDGAIVFVTPTSVLGGQYFKALRELLTKETTVQAIDFISDREGVFDGVLQETMLTSFKKQGINSKLTASQIVVKDFDTVEIRKNGKFSIGQNGEPWLVPRASEQTAFLEKLRQMKTRFSDLGYKISTGPLVWNRHKSQLKEFLSKDSYPLVWAESVSADGFKFSAERRNHVPYIHLRANQDHLLTNTPCVLLQRTTAKEQDRRLISAVLPNSFLKRYQGVVIENHLNVIYQSSDVPTISTATISRLLNSKAVDQAFRCISGSVAVSAYELKALPLPNLAELQAFQKMMEHEVSENVLEKKIASYYAL
jgi:adenine-specific DNA-methyltransferase